MAAFAYKRVETTTMKVVGIIDTNKMVIEVDGQDKELKTLLSGFNRECTEITVKIKAEEDLNEPNTSDED
ncbi:MAG: hypothetical protein LUH21_04040 [Clostridiales bacterium]|nr:hypothetical protein [Clostridiales bacterium]